MRIILGCWVFVLFLCSSWAFNYSIFNTLLIFNNFVLYYDFIMFYFVGFCYVCLKRWYRYFLYVKSEAAVAGASFLWIGVVHEVHLVLVNCHGNQIIHLSHTGNILYCPPPPPHHVLYDWNRLKSSFLLPCRRKNHTSSQWNNDFVKHLVTCFNSVLFMPNSGLLTEMVWRYTSFLMENFIVWEISNCWWNRKVPGK